MEISHVRRRLMHAIESARTRSQERRQRVDEAQRTYDIFLRDIATPIVRQMANALKVEGYAFTVFTPGGAVRLASDRTRDDFIEIGLQTTGDLPEVVGRISRSRGSRTLDDERPIKPGATPDVLSEEDVLEFLATALEPWLER